MYFASVEFQLIWVVLTLFVILRLRHCDRKEASNIIAFNGFRWTTETPYVKVNTKFRKSTKFMEDGELTRRVGDRQVTMMDGKIS